MNIDSQYQIGKQFYPFQHDQQSATKLIKYEPMFFGASYNYAYIHGGPITCAFLDALPEQYKCGIFDSRVHMLMKGWYPCIPGWHHDDVPRSGTDGQPNYNNPEYRSFHIMGLCNGVIAPTQFATGSVDYDVPEGVVYEHWDRKVNDDIAVNNLVLSDAIDCHHIHFNDRTFHQGRPALYDGWRWFGRISIMTSRLYFNEIRNQVQVYLEFPKKGW